MADAAARDVEKLHVLSLGQIYSPDRSRNGRPALNAGHLQAMGLHLLCTSQDTQAGFSHKRERSRIAGSASGSIQQTTSRPKLLGAPRARCSRNVAR